ncbi:MAG: efflux RND transporter permease subunit, partial [Candidatus Sumerlaeia bacterium]
MSPDPNIQDPSESILDKMIRFFLENRIVVVLLLVIFGLWGYMVAPFDWQSDVLPRDPVPVDAIPDIGENQQIVFTEWPGRSPQDVEDQITYPMTASLMGIRGVKSVRSFSMFGFSSIFIIFDDDVEFELSRQRILEKLASLPAGILPEGVQPQLGPDSTALGQVFWYTLEGRDPDGNPTGGWELHELRSIQDWYVRLALLSADGVSEVASVGGFVQEYQIDVNPDAMQASNITLNQVYNAVRMSNMDVGARTIEINNVEYVVRGLGLVKELEDLENVVVALRDGVPIYLKTIADVSLGPALRRGVLDKEGAEVVGGVVVVRYGENPLSTIQSVKDRIAQISPGLPKKTLPDGTVSQVKIVPFYDRTGLIYETLDTLNTALYQQILVTIIVVLVMVMHLRSSILISGLFPLAVLMTFIAMKVAGVDANIVALSGIAIAIGTMVDMGIIICENIFRRLKEAPETTPKLEVVYSAVRQVAGAVVTSSATTIVSFLPIFTMEAAEGKLFKPLAYTKTFALAAAMVIAVAMIPAFAFMIFSQQGKRSRANLGRYVVAAGLVIAGIICMLILPWWVGAIILVLGLWQAVEKHIPEKAAGIILKSANYLAAIFLTYYLAKEWLPLGAQRSLAQNIIFVVAVIGSVLVAFMLYVRVYPLLLEFLLKWKIFLVAVTLFLILMGGMIWLGFPRIFGWLPDRVRAFGPVTKIAHEFPGLGKEFMPSLNEGSFLYMPTTMPHAGIGEVHEVLRMQDMAMKSIPEVDMVVGKLGRADTPLDPAPVSMIETIIEYKAKFLRNENGRMIRFRYEPDETDLFRDVEGEPVPAPDGEPYMVQGKFLRDDEGKLIPDKKGRPFLQWRPALDPELNPERTPWPGIQTAQDIWDRIVDVAQMPGTTSAPKLQPIETRIVMLQSGMRAPMGIKVQGPDLETIETVGLEIERYLKEVPAIAANTVNAERIVGKPYLEIRIDREKIARYGLHTANVQEIISVAIGGKPLTTTIEGRERYPVRVRYPRERRDTIESLERILVPASGGMQIPLGQLA